MDWASTLIGAAIGFLSSVGIIIVERLFDRSGKLKIYAKIVYNLNGNETWGFYERSEGLFFCVPLWIELENTSNITRTIRDADLILFKGKTKVAEMIQINKSIKGDREFYFANEGSYSFILDPKSIHQYECYFKIKYNPEKNQAFDKIMLRYFDERDNEQFFTLATVDGDWKTKQFPITGKWQYLNKE